MKTSDPITRFWNGIDATGECWEWKSSRPRGGYGSLSVNGRSTPAHRFSWALHFGPIPDGLFVLHRCDNPPCVRPDHLFLGTTSDNAKDAVAKGRAKIPHQGQTHCKHGHEFTPENTRMYDGERRCIACERAYYQKNKHMACYR